MPELQFQLARWWPLLILPPALWFVIRMSLSGLPAQPVVRRRLLAGLRAFSLLLLVLLLCGPEVAWQEVEEEPARLALLLDDSRSLTVLDADLRLVEWLEPLREALPDVELELFAFGDTLRALDRDDLSELAGEEGITDPERALRLLGDAMADRNWTGSLLLSDGHVTRGAWPVERALELGRPLWTVGVGRQTALPDMALVDLRSNDPVEPGSVQPVQAQIAATGLEGLRARVVLSVDDQPRDSIDLVLGAEGTLQLAELSWQPSSEGRRRLELAARLLDGEELTLDNNRRLLQVQVLPASRRVLLLAGSVSPDLAFLRRGLEADPERIRLAFAMPDRGNSTQEQLLDAARGSDLLVLAHWPTSSTDAGLVRRLLELDKPLLWLGGQGAEPGHLLPALAGLAATATPERVAGRVRVERVHPLLGEEEQLGQLDRIWEEMPPLRSPGTRWPGGWRSLLSETDGGPLLLLREGGELRSAWLPAAGYWRWEVSAALRPDLMARARHWREALFAWLLASPESRLLQVEPEREVWSAGRPLVFRARLREEDGQPRDGASLTLQLERVSEGGVRQLLLEAEGSGRYRGVLPGLATGEWHWRAEARQGDRELLADSGRVLVESFSPEALATVRNVALLKQLAASTGGEYLDLDDPGDLARLASGESFAGLERRPMLRERPRIREAIGEIALLILLLASFCAEWILRRFGGML